MLGILCRYLAFYASRLDELGFRHDAAEPCERRRRIRQQDGCTRGPRRPDVALQQAEDALLLVVLELHQGHELVVDEPRVGVEQKALAAGHARAEIAAVGTEHDDGAPCHVLARMVADALAGAPCSLAIAPESRAPTALSALVIA